MKVCVVGAGVIGITTAYALAKRGYEVTVVDASDSFGKGTSYANGAQLSYSYVAPLAEPAIWRQLPAYLLSSTSPLTWKPEFKLRQWTWLVRFLAACNATDSRRTTAMLLELASLSRTKLHELQNRYALKFNHRAAGKLVMISSEKAFDGAWRQIRLQADLGCEQQLLRRDECVAVEPALAHAIQRWVGGVYTPSEEIGDCVQFCEQLGATLIRDYGVQFLFNASVNKVRHSRGIIHAVGTSIGDITADHFVLANGVGSARLAQQVGLRLPVYPLKGYSVTIESDKLTARLPSVSITDQAKKIVYARIGNKLRVAGRAEIVGEDLHIDEKRCNELALEARQLFFPDDPAEDSVAPWAGLRPATPSGRPIIGKTPVANLFLNCGHGALGWTLACGSAELLAADIAGKARPIQGLSQGLAA
ncbi:amino acid dehydrogenase [Noviherbaspirillum sp. Root189]|nr:amino acid dehydrogenase [Noviherbaspirillum sp. Root189]